MPEIIQFLTKPNTIQYLCLTIATGASREQALSLVLTTKQESRNWKTEEPNGHRYIKLHKRETQPTLHIVQHSKQNTKILPFSKSKTHVQNILRQYNINLQTKKKTPLNTTLDT